MNQYNCKYSRCVIADQMFKVHNVPGDGNCFFHCWSLALHNNSFNSFWQPSNQFDIEKPTFSILDTCRIAHKNKHNLWQLLKSHSYRTECNFWRELLRSLLWKSFPCIPLIFMYSYARKVTDEEQHVNFEEYPFNQCHENHLSAEHSYARNVIDKEHHVNFAE